MFFIKQDSIIKYGKQLNKISKTAFPHVVRQSLSGAAFTTMQIAKHKTLPKKMILRNKYTQSAVQYTPASGYDIDTMVAFAGAKSTMSKGVEKNRDYLSTQEHGGAIPPKHKSIMIPTLQSRTNKNIHKPVSHSLRLDRIYSGGLNKEKFFIGNSRNNKRILFQRAKGSKLISLRIVVSRPIQIKATHWLHSSIVTSKEMDRLFLRNARARIAFNG